MKKTLLSLIALFITTIAFASVKIDGIYYNLNDDNKTAEVTSNSNKYYGTITIPEKVTYNSTEYSVNSIGSSAFYQCSSLTSITIPNSVTYIGSWAFSECSSLTSISIPNSVTSIGNYVFYYCTSLTSITIPNSVTSIGGSAFYSCSSLTSITIPNSVTSIGYQAFSNCSRLTSITIPNSVTSIGGSTFSGCSSLTSITIPNSVTSIGGSAFYSCSRLYFITIEATTPPTLGSSDAFDQGRAIYIPDNTLSAYKSAWGTDYVYVNNETSLTINVETPGTLSDLIFDAGFRPIEVAKLKVTGTLNDDDFTCMRETMTSLVDIDLSEITNTTGVNFDGKNNLVKIILPNNLTSIGKYAFYECTSLTSITIPNSVTSIGYQAFSHCSRFTSITIPNSVTSIGYQAFSHCSRLTSITIPNSVTEIGEYAFYSCSSLTSITIPNSVTSIGSYAFKSCSKLNTITCLGSTPPAATDLEANTQTCVLVVPKKAYTNYLRHAYWGQFLTIRTIGDKEIKTAVNNSTWGKVTGAGVYNENDEATLTATANSGYRFVKWSDEVTDNPRTIVVTQDSTFTAIFEPNTFTITTAVNNEDMGSVTEGGEYAHGAEVTLTATANTGYRFAQWSDGNTENPRTITVTENKTYTAEFTLEEFALYATSAVPTMGYVEHIIRAVAIEGFEFDRWSDDNTENPRTIVLTEDTKLYAYFKMSSGENPVNLETSKIQSANVYTNNGILHVEGAETNYHILDAAGRLIYSGNASTLSLPRGIYLVTINGETQKIVL